MVYKLFSFDWEISIHAPRVGGDVHALQHGGVLSVISIHAPRVGGDLSKLNLSG